MSRPSDRLVSLDAFRGFIMLLMASSSFGIPMMAKNHPDSAWVAISSQFVHREWVGCSLWDLIQPSFMFMVGVAGAYSYARRALAGDGFFKMLGHALIRAVVLVLLAVLLTSNHKNATEWIFTNVLAQIGLGYLFLYLLWKCGWEVQVATVILILVSYWLWFLIEPLPAALPPDGLSGFFAHWNIHTNAAARFDQWFLNLFPRDKLFESNAGGYQTLNFIPSLATMTLGLITGRFLHRSEDLKQTFARLIVAGIVLLLLGALAGFLACPIVKRIWTPSWVLFSGGWVLLLLAAFYWLVEIAGQRRLVFPLVVVGMNSIFVYVMHSLCAGWIRETLVTHLGKEAFSGYYGPLLEKSAVLLVLWMLCLWLYRQRVFLKI
jgi:predicted acyltransferase